ncbi:MAG: hypothetical protein ACRDLB_08810 [Actinomycetota bacterium]
MAKYRELVAAGVVVLMTLTVPAGAFDPFGRPPARPGRATTATGVGGIGMRPYRNLGSWIDMFDKGPWDDPERAVARAANRGVTTLYIQTANYRSRRAIYRPRALGKLIDAAHLAGLDVVAWYLPSFKHLKKDLKRSKAAIDFETDIGGRFDSFAMDIESTEVDDIDRRNERMLRLSRRVRRYIGGASVMAAIVPEAGALYWPSFPYASVANHYDLFMPMGYFTYRVRGRAAVRRYTRSNVDAVRSGVGDATFPVHPIGGIAGRTRAGEVRAYVKAVQGRAALGGSLYDLPITKKREWRELGPLAR